MKKILIAVLMAGLTLLATTSTVLAEPRNSVTISKEIDFMLWILGDTENINKPNAGLNFKIISKNSIKEEYVLSSSFPNQPAKILFKMPPQLLSADLYDFGKENYKIRLCGFSVGIPYESAGLKGNVSTVILLKLDTKFIKAAHFDILLKAIRTKTSADIEGYVYDKEKDIELIKRGSEAFTIIITLHPVSINGEKLY